MQVKIFEAEDMASGLRMVKENLGPDALIISTRTIKSSKLGLLGKSTLEITAAIDNTPTKPPTSSFAPKRDLPSIKPVRAKKKIDYVVDDSLDIPELPDNSTYKPIYQSGYATKRPANEATAAKVEDTVEKPMFVEQLQQQDNSNIRPPSTAFSTPSVSEEKLMDEVEDLKKLVKSLAGEVARLQPTAQPFAATPASPTNSLAKSSEELLNDSGINEEISDTIAQFIQNSLSAEELQDSEKVKQNILQSISSMIEVTSPFHDDEEQQRIAFVGPTGVGKTTTLAKLAAAKLSQGSHSIALITIDTYRIAAVEQLKVYGEIMNLPVEVVISPEQLESALLKHRDCDLILIDTAGRSPKDDLSIDELSTYLRPELNVESHLVLSATSREKELLETIDKFSNLDIYSTIYTKIDECSNLGPILNVQIHNSRPISCLTNGQRVPEDLLEISPQRIAELILSSN